MKRRWIGILSVAATLLLTGCSDFVDQDQVRLESGVEAILSPGHPVGQTFVARHAGLDGVQVWLNPGQGVDGEIRLHLRTDPQVKDDLTTAVLPLAQVTAPGFYRFSFDSLRDSHSRYYYVFLETAGDVTIQVGAGPGNAYLDGAIYHDHKPLDAQMAFRLTYDSRWMLLDVGWAGISGLGLLAVAGLLYVIPGWALLTCLWPENYRLPWAERLCVAAGLSLALYPLLFLWTDLVGLHLGPLYAWLPVIGGLVALVWRYRDWRPRRCREAIREWVHSSALWSDLALLAVVGLVFGVRLLVVRSLDAPMWGDSYQHTMIAQLMVDHGGLFDSWEPYAPLPSFTYHFGFHTAVAAFHWLTGIQTTQAVIWVGQILNGLAVWALYPLAVRVGKSRWAGVVAVLVAGLFSPMPMYYVNWGRYTQLAGQVILPAAVLLTYLVAKSPRRDWSRLVPSWVAVGGLALTHYRVLIFYVIFVLVWVMVTFRPSSWRRTLARVTQVGATAAMLFFPWFVHVFAGDIMRLFGEKLSATPGQLSSFDQQCNAIGDLTFYLAPVGWLLLIIAISVGLWQRRRGALLMSLWWFLLLIATNPDWLNLPGSGIISNFALFIAAYILVGVLVGSLFGWLVARWESRKWFGVLIMLFLIGAGLAGARMRMKDVLMPQHAMVTRPDARAMAWIQENTPENSRFLINSFLAYGGNAVVGADGGWWMPLLGRRANTIPPLNYGTEQLAWPGYIEWVRDPTRLIQEAGIDDLAMLALLQEREITHVYVGQQQGRVNYAGPHILDPNELFHNAHYRSVYHQDRVWVFEVVR